MSTTMSPVATITSETVNGYQGIRAGAALIDYTAAGLFRLSGRDSRDVITALTTRGVDFLLVGQSQQALILAQDGTIISDVMVHGLEDGYLLQVWPDQAEQAGNRLESAVVGRDATLSDVSNEFNLIGVEGPTSYRLVDGMVDFAISSVNFQTWVDGCFNGHSLMISRTGVTGEFGYLIMAPAGIGDAIISELIQNGATWADRTSVDICRMEMRFPNLEVELSHGAATPFDLGLQWLVDFDQEFTGKEAVLAAEELTRRPVCWSAPSGSTTAPPPGAPVSVSDAAIGSVGHALYSPGLDRVIGTALVDAECAGVGLCYRIDDTEVTTVSAPFLVATSFSTTMD